MFAALYEQRRDLEREVRQVFIGAAAAPQCPRTSNANRTAHAYTGSTACAHRHGENTQTLHTAKFRIIQ